MQNLVYLDLSYNSSKNVEREAFDGLHNLTYLDLSDNWLETPAAFLRPLSSLRVLNLANQFYRVKYFATEVSKLKQLEKLRMFGDHLSKDDIYQLRNISITYLSIILFTYTIEAGSFSVWNNLNSLELKSNEFFNIDATDLLKKSIRSSS